MSLVLRCNVQGIIQMTLRGNSANLEHHVSIPNTRATNQLSFLPVRLEEKDLRVVAAGGIVNEGVMANTLSTKTTMETETPGRPDANEGKSRSAS